MELLSFLIWVSIGLFVLGILFDGWARELTATGWVAFGVYWITRAPRYYGETHSFIKTILVVAALPMSLYFAYRIAMGERYAPTLVKLSQAVAAMGLIYLPFTVWEPLNHALIEHTAAQEYRVLSALGIDARLVERDGLRKQFVVTHPETGEAYSTYIILACTGIGSMSIFGGIIAAIDAPLSSKLKAFSVSIPVIYVLNLVRNAFITTAYGHQWFTFADGTIADFMGETAGYASFFWADKVISQSLSIVALVGITLLVVRFMPEVMDFLEELLEVVGVGTAKSASEA